MHGFSAVATKQGKVVHLTRRAGFNNEASTGAQTFLDQMLVHGRGGKQCRDGDAVGIQLAVGDDQDVGARTHRVFGVRDERSQTGFDAFLAPGDRIADIEFERAELAAGVFLDVTDLLHVVEGQHRLRNFQTDRRVDVRDIQQVRLRPDEGHHRHDQLLADRVDRRVGHLSEQLLEVIVENLFL